MHKKIKIFLGLIEVAGYLQNLKKGFDDIGIESEIITIHSHKFYSNEINYLSKLSHFFYDNFINSTSYIVKKGYYCLWKLSFVPLFLYSILKFDTFIFFGGNTFFNYKELFLLKLLKKRIIYVFLGSDARPPYMNAFFVNKFKNNFPDLIQLTAEKKKKIQIIEKYADEIISHHTISQFLSKNYIDFDYIGNPRESLDYEYNIKNVTNEVKILHIPSRAEIKGTNYFQEIINNLINKGYNIKYNVKTDITNDDVIKEIKSCDIILDEIYADVPYGGIAAEGAMLKKAVLLSGHNDFYIKKDNSCSCYCYPEDLENNIVKLIEDKNFYNSVVNKSYEYFFNNLSRERVAEKYYKIVLNDVPKRWYKNPFDDKYIFGYGLSKEKLREVLEIIILNYGKDKLYLNDKPNIIKILLEFIKRKKND